MNRRKFLLSLSAIILMANNSNAMELPKSGWRGKTKTAEEVEEEALLNILNEESKPEDFAYIKEVKETTLDSFKMNEENIQNHLDFMKNLNEGNLNEAKTIAEKLVFSESDDEMANIVGNVYFGEILKIEGDYERALYYHDKAFFKLKDNEDYLIEYIILSRFLINTFVLNNEFDKALKYIDYIKRNAKRIKHANILVVNAIENEILIYIEKKEFMLTGNKIKLLTAALRNAFGLESYEFQFSYYYRLKLKNAEGKRKSGFQAIKNIQELLIPRFKKNNLYGYKFIDIYFEMADFLFKFEKYKESNFFLKENEKLIHNLFPNETSINIIGELYKNYARNYKKMNDFKTAHDYLNKAKEIFQDIYGPMGDKTLDINLLIGFLYYEEGDVQTAVKILQENYKILISKYGESNIKTKILRSNIRYIQKKYEIEEAENSFENNY